VDIVRRLDGIPLAIELAAARVGTLGLQTLAQRLDQRFRLLTTGSRTALPRHQTLGAAFDWSHELLTEAERALFRRAAIFSGGWTLEAAEAVYSDDLLFAADVIDVLGSLVGKSLVVADDDGSSLRYRLLESSRAYALEKLVESGEQTTLAGRHARWVEAFVERAYERGTSIQLQTPR
jgi:predicted ATPase